MVDVGGALTQAWPHVTTALAILLSSAASIHAILLKRDVRAAIGWVGVAWLVPFVGAVLYWLLGINRIHRQARALRLPRSDQPGPASPVGGMTAGELQALLPGEDNLMAMHRLGDWVLSRPLVAGNEVELLDGGSQAYPAMLEAIASARRSVTLCTYIFDDDRVGKRFVEALEQAVERGVQVRVLVDSVGSRYSTPPIQWRLRRANVRHALFLPTWKPGLLPFMNLRNHRKILVVDGTEGFTGGMNLRDDFWRDDGGENAHDLHFRLRGPVVAHLQECFAEDWKFSAGEALAGEPWFADMEPSGALACRGVQDGPDEDFETLRHILLGGIAVSRRTVRIVTPYFLPDPSLITALRVAALRGVDVQIIMPEKTNIPFVGWASMAQIDHLMDAGCHVYLTPPPFDHSKLMVVDGAWSLIGSTNWDPRSLRLNFEFNVEAYGHPLAATLDHWIDRRLQSSHALTLAEVRSRSFPVRLRDGIARLFSPYL